MGFFSSFHSNDFSTHVDQCGSCGRSEVSNRRLECYCNKYRKTFRLDEPKCRDYVKDKSRDYDFWKKIYSYYILTAIFDILKINKNNKMYLDIKNVIDNVRIDENTQVEAIGYNVFGKDIADRLRMDIDRELICQDLLINDISEIYIEVNMGNIDEAIKLYRSMVEKLFHRYEKMDNYETIIDANKLKK